MLDRAGTAARAAPGTVRAVRALVPWALAWLLLLAVWTPAAPAPEPSAPADLQTVSVDPLRTGWDRTERDQRPFADWAATTGTDWATYSQESPGMSAFALDDGVVYHTYSAYARGLDGLWGMYQWLDRAPLGRNEERAPDAPLNFFRRHDEYAS